MIPFGWKSLVSNFSLGGCSAYVGGNVIRALKQPPTRSKLASNAIPMPYTSSSTVVQYLSSQRALTFPQNPPADVPVSFCVRMCVHALHSPPYKLSCSSSSMSMISHSKILLSASPQLMPGMSLSVCICLNCLPRRIAALD